MAKWTSYIWTCALATLLSSLPTNSQAPGVGPPPFPANQGANFGPPPPPPHNYQYPPPPPQGQQPGPAELWPQHPPPPPGVNLNNQPPPPPQQVPLGFDLHLPPPQGQGPPPPPPGGLDLGMPPPPLPQGQPPNVLDLSISLPAPVQGQSPNVPDLSLPPLPPQDQPLVDLSLPLQQAPPQSPLSLPPQEQLLQKQPPQAPGVIEPQLSGPQDQPPPQQQQQQQQQQPQPAANQPQPPETLFPQPPTGGNQPQQNTPPPAAVNQPAGQSQPLVDLSLPASASSAFAQQQREMKQQFQQEVIGTNKGTTSSKTFPNTAPSLEPPGYMTHGKHKYEVDAEPVKPSKTGAGGKGGKNGPKYQYEFDLIEPPATTPPPFYAGYYNAYNYRAQQVPRASANVYQPAVPAAVPQLPAVSPVPAVPAIFPAARNPYGRQQQSNYLQQQQQQQRQQQLMQQRLKLQQFRKNLQQRSRLLQRQQGVPIQHQARTASPNYFNAIKSFANKLQKQTYFTQPALPTQRRPSYANVVASPAYRPANYARQSYIYPAQPSAYKQAALPQTYPLTGYSLTLSQAYPHQAYQPRLPQSYQQMAKSQTPAPSPLVSSAKQARLRNLLLVAAEELSCKPLNEFQSRNDMLRYTPSVCGQGPPCPFELMSAIQIAQICVCCPRNVTPQVISQVAYRKSYSYSYNETH